MVKFCTHFPIALLSTLVLGGAVFGVFGAFGFSCFFFDCVGVGERVGGGVSERLMERAVAAVDANTCFKCAGLNIKGAGLIKPVVFVFFAASVLDFFGTGVFN